MSKNTPEKGSQNNPYKTYNSYINACLTHEQDCKSVMATVDQDALPAGMLNRTCNVCQKTIWWSSGGRREDERETS